MKKGIRHKICYVVTHKCGHRKLFYKFYLARLIVTEVCNDYAEEANT